MEIVIRKEMKIIRLGNEIIIFEILFGNVQGQLYTIGIFFWIFSKEHHIINSPKNTYIRVPSRKPSLGLITAYGPKKKRMGRLDK